MSEKWRELMEFPSQFTYKAFGVQPVAFPQQVWQAVNEVVAVPWQQVQTRPSRQGTYVCVSVSVTVADAEQIEAIYQRLQQLENLRYLL